MAIKSQQDTTTPPKTLSQQRFERYIEPKVTEAELRTELNQVVFDSLRPLSAALGVLYIILGINYFFFLPAPYVYSITLVAVITSLILFALWRLLDGSKISLYWAHPLGGAIASLVTFNVLYRLYLLNDIHQTYNILLVIVGFGFLMLSTPWTVSMIAVTAIAWEIVVVSGNHVINPVDFRLPLISATALSLVVNITRVRTIRGLKRLRLRDHYHNQRLEMLYQNELSRRKLAERLYQIGQAITGTLELDPVLNLILENLVDIVPYNRAAVMLQIDDELESLLSKGFPPDYQNHGVRIKLHENDVYAQIYRTSEPLNIPDVLQIPHWQQLEGLPLARAWLGVPLKHRDGVIGMLSLTREEAKPYNEEEVTFATTFADQAAIALENARMYSQISGFNQTLQQEVQRRTEDLRQAYLHLEKLDQAKSDFISIASHELRTPLTTIRGYAQMLAKDAKIKENAFHAELMSTIYARAIQLGEVVDSMADMARIDSRSFEIYPEPVSLATILDDTSERFISSLKERNLSLNQTLDQDFPHIEADPDALSKVFYHLISNAIKYTPDGGQITIQGQALDKSTEDMPETSTSTEHVEIIVSDTGIGIDPEAQELVFTKFFQTGELALHSTGRTKFKGGGPGLGLTIVKGIVEAHYGRTWLESPGYDEETLPGTQVHVILPLKQLNKNEPETLAE